MSVVYLGIRRHNTTARLSWSFVGAAACLEYISLPLLLTLLAHGRRWVLVPPLTCPALHPESGWASRGHGALCSAIPSSHDIDNAATAGTGCLLSRVAVLDSRPVSRALSICRMHLTLLSPSWSPGGGSHSCWSWPRGGVLDLPVPPAMTYMMGDATFVLMPLTSSSSCPSLMNMSLILHAPPSLPSFMHT